MTLNVNNMGRPYIIGETAYNHEGNIDYLYKMIDEIAGLKLDAVKFHLIFDLESYVVGDHPLMDEMKNWMFTCDQWKKVIEYSLDKDLDVICLCDDVESVDFVHKNFPDIAGMELHTTSLNDYFLLEKVADFKGCVVLGVGGSSLNEVQFAVDFLKNKGKDDILLMYGFQSFPTKYEDTNLSKMKKIKDLFDLPVGYADHTRFDDPNNEIISIMGAMMGFPILEKHFTLDPCVERIDYHAAVGKKQMNRIKKLMELALQVYGGGSLKMSEAELKYGNTGPMKKAVVAKKQIRKGERLSKNNLWFKRTMEESPVKQKDFSRLIGLEVTGDIGKDEIVDFSKVKYEFQKQDLKTLGLKEKK